MRLASWNLDWFPDRGDQDGSDPEWLACAVASLDADIVAVQAVRVMPRTYPSFASLRSSLREITGAEWRLEADDCLDTERLHLGFLYRTDRVQLSHPVTYPEIDVTPNPRREKDPRCSGGFAPALGAYFQADPKGVDLHVINVLLANGREATDLAARQQSWAKLGPIVQARTDLIDDKDVIVLGDFATVGAAAGEITNAQLERATLAKTLTQLPEPLSLTSSALECTSYAVRARQKPEPTTQIAVSAGMREAYGIVAQAAGICQLARCEPIKAVLPSFARLSRHCPVIIDLFNVDDDGPAAPGSHPAEASSPPPVAAPADATKPQPGPAGSKSTKSGPPLQDSGSALDLEPIPASGGK